MSKNSNMTMLSCKDYVFLCEVISDREASFLQVSIQY
jgi:hypothetical protein